MGAEEALRQLADRLEPLGRHLPVALALLAALLATLLLFRARPPTAASAAAGAGKAGKKRTFTAAEVAAHDREDDVWIILNGKVYDVTPYVEEHPGGRAILRNAGRDSTSGFHGPQHPDRVFDLIDDFYIGDLALG